MTGVPFALSLPEYAASMRAAGFESVRFDPIPVKHLTPATRVPRLKDLLIFGIDCHVRRPAV